MNKEKIMMCKVKVVMVCLGCVSLLVNVPAVFAGVRFSEDWETGSIDSAKWHAWGSPASYLYEGSETLDDYSFLQ